MVKMRYIHTQTSSGAFLGHWQHPLYNRCLGIREVRLPVTKKMSPQFSVIRSLLIAFHTAYTQQDFLTPMHTYLTEPVSEVGCIRFWWLRQTLTCVYMYAVTLVVLWVWKGWHVKAGFSRSLHIPQALGLSLGLENSKTISRTAPHNYFYADTVT